MPRRSSVRLALAIATLLLSAARGALALDPPADPRLACDRAAAKAETAWNLPAGLLAAIGTVESGGIDRHAWPWAINAEGWSIFASSRAEAVSTVAALQRRGLRYIDVGCFQVDLFFHPRAFASLDEAFDPDANAQAASRILALARFGSAGWDQAIAAYHSASLLRGAWYLQRVLAAWPGARTRLARLDAMPAYAVLLSPEASRVRIVTASDPVPLPWAGLPRVIAPKDIAGPVLLIGAAGRLPRVVTP